MKRLLCAAVAVLISSAANSAPCDVSQFKDQINYHGKLEATLAYTDQIASALASEGNQGLTVNFMDLGDIGFSDANKITQSLKRIMQINWTHSEEHWLMVSQLSDNGKDALIQCFKASTQEPIVVTFTEGAAYKPAFNVQALWQQNAPNPANVQWLPINAEVIGSNPPQPSVNTAETAIVQMTRQDPFQSVDLTVSIGGKYATASLPALPKYRLAKEVRSVKSKVNEVYGGNDDIIETMCVTIPNEEQDAFIIPGSAHFKPSPVILNMGSISELPGTQYLEDRQACTRVRWGLSSAQGRVRGDAEFSVSVYKAVPIELPKQHQFFSDNSFTDFAATIPTLQQMLITPQVNQ